jgi:assimilatory nitrate reductase electron transfer subunit
VCTCNSVTAGRIRDAVRSGCASVADVAAATRASTGCGDCASVVQALISSGTPTEIVTDSTTETGAKALVRSQP